ncbi:MULTISPECIES: T6SS immunity protein Tli3 family protein [unclassified Variovorax]|uniref:T6SS immunity protein Tli3 family protein n=1 Tax=unclassified Variovorax TaxID=663243 RepID=UPI003F462B3F
MSQGQDLSSLTPVVLDPGKHQWVECKSTGIDYKQNERTRIRRLRWLSSVVLVLGLCACAQAVSPSKVRPAASAKPPQVVYRIDDHRHFELTPDETCFGNMLYFVDTAKGIRSEVVTFDAVMNRTTLIIDAANDQYLVAPVTRGGINCSSGGGGCTAATMPYSIDGGRTWKRVWSPGTSDDLMVGGSTAYQSRYRPAYRITSTYTLDLTIPEPQSNDWKFLNDEHFVFKPRIAQLDTKVQCKAQDNRSSK